MNFKVTKNKIIAAIAIGLVLLATFWYGGNAPGLRGWNASEPTKEVMVSNIEEDLTVANDTTITEDIFEEASELKEEEPEEKVESKPELEPESESKSEAKVEISIPKKENTKPKEMVMDKKTGKDEYQTEPVPEGKPIPMEPQDAKISDKAYTVTLSVRADTILNNMEWLDPEKIELVPADGVIFPATKVTFYEGESVFNVLQREMKKAKVHMEFTNTPIYNSAHIDGIQNLYEFDCGELSGWLYKVNGWFPKYGASRYALKEGDTIEWVYTCDLGIDVGRDKAGRQME